MCPVGPCCHSFTASGSAGGGNGKPASQELSAAAIQAGSAAQPRTSRSPREQETYERSACEHNDERLPACRRWEVKRVWEGEGGRWGLEGEVSVLTTCMCFEKLRVDSEGMLPPREEVICLSFCFFSAFCFMLFSHHSTVFV